MVAAQIEKSFSTKVSSFIAAFIVTLPQPFNTILVHSYSYSQADGASADARVDRGSRSHPPPPRPQVATSPMPSGGLHAVYERRAGRRRTSGWCTWSRDFSESWSVEAGRQPARRRRPAPLHGQFSRGHLPHLPAHEGKRSTQDEAALQGGRGASSDSPHQSSPTSHPPHPASMRSRASSDLIAGKAARRRRQRGRSGRRSRSRGKPTRRES